MNGALLNFLNFFLHFIAFFLLLHVFREKKSRIHAPVSSHSRDERRQRLVRTTRIDGNDARASFF